MIKILKNKQVVSELITTLIGLFIITIMLVISLSFVRVANKQAVLNEFANQMIITACDYGKTSGSEIDDRYTVLEKSLQISPDITYNNPNSTVQYGEIIEITVKSEESINILGINIPMEFEITKTGRSDYYWK